MENLRGLTVWDKDTKSLRNTCPKGSLSARLVETIIASVREAELYSVHDFEIFSQNRDWHISMVRGFLMVSVYDALISLELGRAASFVVSGIFMRDRACVYHYLKKAESAKDEEYEKVRHGPAGIRIKEYFADFVAGASVFGATKTRFSVEEVRRLVEACPGCLAKFLGQIENSETL